MQKIYYRKLSRDHKFFHTIFVKKKYLFTNSNSKYFTLKKPYSVIEYSIRARPRHKSEQGIKFKRQEKRLIYFYRLKIIRIYN